MPSRSGRWRLGARSGAAAFVATALFAGAAVAQQAELFERTAGDSGNGAVIAIPVESAADILRGAVELVRKGG